MYIVAHDFDLSLLQPQYLGEFQAQFPKHFLPGILASFSQPRQLSEHMLAHSPEAVEERLQMVRHGLCVRACVRARNTCACIFVCASAFVPFSIPSRLFFLSAALVFILSLLDYSSHDVVVDDL
jgi:hypothetical protein